MGNMKILGLDVGKAWVGVAISDPMGIVCRPYKTVRFEELIPFLQKAIEEEFVGTVVVGHPITVKGKVSAQTEEIEEVFEKLRAQFSSVNDRDLKWILWDERFSSKRASSILKKHDRGDKKEHSIAAAFILQSYLDNQAFQRQITT